jgi:hypothetical protein
VKQRARKLKKIESRENSGDYGKWRKDFCLQYLDALVQARENTHNALLASLAASDETISCRKGCIYCCFQYVTVSLAQAMVITDYLYGRKELLKQFLSNYAQWRRQGYDMAKRIDCIRNQALAASMRIDGIITATRPLSHNYFKAHIACPFLSGNRCLIYYVRPLQCSGHYAVSPPERCAATSGTEPSIYQLIPRDQDLMRMMQMADPNLTLHEYALPSIVYKLITKGSAAVIKAKGPKGRNR